MRTIDQILNVGSASLLIIHETGLVLGVHRKNNENDWGLAGGKREKNESSIQCAVRETYEETSVMVQPENCMLLYVARARVSISATYLVLYTKGIVPGPGDSGMSKWVPWDYLEAGTFGIYNKKLHEVYNEFMNLYGK